MDTMIKSRLITARPCLLALVSLFLFAGTSMLLCRPAIAKPKVLDPKVSMVEGDVVRKAPELSNWEGATVGDHLVSGENLKTGIKSRSEVEFASGRMRLYQNSLLVVPQIDTEDEDANDIRHMEIESGAGIFNILKRGRKKGFTFGTKHIIGGVKGTIFSLKTMINWTEVAVMRGVVEVADRKNPSNKIILRKGEKITFWADIGFGGAEEDVGTDEEEKEESRGSGGGRFGPVERFKDPDEWKDWSDNYELVLEETKDITQPDDPWEDQRSDNGDGDSWTDNCPPENDKSDPITR
jgi:hypothetical protein